MSLRSKSRVAVWMTLGCVAMALGSQGLAQEHPASAKAVAKWQELKFGLFIHWGLYSIPGGVWEGKLVTVGYSEQIQSHARISNDKYAALAGQFNPTKFDPDAICELAKDAGMKYIVLTAKHHDGFNMYHTKLTKFNVVDATPFGKDVLKLLADACARHGLKLGIYYSLPDWNYQSETPANPFGPVLPKTEKPAVGRLEELLTGYGPVVEIWFDMAMPTEPRSVRFVATVRRLQPDTLVATVLSFKNNP